MTRFLTVLAGALLLSGCGDDRELREWTPEDHGQPPQSQADPSRIPGNQPTGTPQERAAAALWIMQCAGCHGRGGRGDGPEQPPGVQLPDFTRAEFQASRTDQELAAAITQGQGEMEGFGDRLPQQAIAALVGHIRRLGPRLEDLQPTPEAPPGQTPPTDRPPPDVPEPEPTGRQIPTQRPAPAE